MLAGLIAFSADALAHPPADDFLNQEKVGPGSHLTLMPFIGPGFRATFDHRFEVEKEMSEIRTQIIGTTTIPFSELSANVDARFFLMNFGASVGFHDEWHMLQFTPDPSTGYDRAGQSRVQVDPANPDIATDPNVGFRDLTLDTRAIKDQNADYRQHSWWWEELRWGFFWPAYNFVASSNLAFRHEGHPDVVYDWENATVMNGGWNIRWEGYALFRSRNVGFIGPAWRLMVLPRNRTVGDWRTPSGLQLLSGSACQPNVVAGIECVETHEVEFQYGFLAGFRPNWVNSWDTFIVRAYTTAGLDRKQMFGTQAYKLPLQLLVAYMVDFDL